MFEKFHRGDIYSADLSPGIGSEQSGSRPVLILQNNVGNCFSPTIIIAAITSVSKKSRKCALPGFVDSKNEEKTERNAGYLVVSHSGGGML
ncbi:type II toxin-antitoxin system PemK/MazF family toxin, partial [Ruthenibacterium lactatiformans]|uniref:type II toxin-antitoxin system PemK/MazF family toxin n=1 Tax=Ruthenibacterium lactatiformans TaxID=1550024 RepID=UPI001FC85E4A